MDRSTGNTYNVSKEQIASGCARRRFRAYPEYKNSGVEWLDQIPSHWNVKRLKYIASINDEVLAETTDPQYEMTYVDIGGVDQYQGIVNREKYVFETAPSRARRKVREGDVIISTVRTYLRAIAQIEAPESNLTVSTGFAVIRTGLIFSSRYAAYALRASYFIEKIVANSVGVSYPAIDASKMSGFSASFPELMEQEAIAAFLDRETAKIDALIEKKERLIELLQEKRTALITQAVTKGLDPTVPMKDSGVEWLGEIPAHWEVKRLRHVGSAIIGLTYEPGDVVGPDEGMLVLRASNVCDGHIVLDDNVFVKRLVRDCLVTREGDILICSRSGSRNLIGKSAKIDKTVMGLTFGAFMTVFRSVCNDYLFYAFNSTLFNCQSGAFLTSTINQLTLGNLNSFTIPVPPSIEQIEITAFLDCEIAKIDALASRIREVIAHLREYRVALVSAAVTGKIDIRTEPVEARNAR